MIRQVSSADLEVAADFLDSRTLVLRWLVALARRLSYDASDASDRLSLWWTLREEPGGCVREGLGGVSSVLAYFRPNGTLYVAGDPDAEFPLIDDLCREQLLPARVVGDAEVVDAWRAAAPDLFDAARASDLDVLLYEGGASVPPGFRPARGGDLDLLREYLRILYVELEEVGPPSMLDLIEAGLVFVLEEESRVKGMILANPSDGRYVHGCGVFVHPAYRGRGVGRRLAAGLGATILGEMGVSVLLDAFPENARALAAYRSAGYRSRGSGRVVWFRQGAWGSAPPFPFGAEAEER